MKQWLLSQLPMKVLTLTLLYSGSTHGWEDHKFHELCDEKGPTITVMKSRASRVFGGFAMQSWESLKNDDFDDEIQNPKAFKADDEAFIYSIDRQQIYRVIDAQKALYCDSDWGPSFGGYALGLLGNKLNSDNAGMC
jgi:hypothetical protein